jgi:hypothetical protein
MEPPMPLSSAINDLVDRIANGVMALINSQPRSPTKEEIARVVTDLVGALGTTTDFLVVSREWLENRDKQDKPVRTARFDPHRHHRCYDDRTGTCDACGTPFIQWGTTGCLPTVVEENCIVPGYKDEDGAVIAFKPFIQYDGPKMQWYRGDFEGQRYEYQTFRWVSEDPAKIVARLHSLASQITRAGGHTIVWRQRPELTKLSDGRLKCYCRLHTIPGVKLDGDACEGGKAPEA